jgi:hypothetical protein
MKAIGLDIGGTKIEAQVFDADWQVAERRRIATPSVYPDLVSAVAAQIAWAEGVAGIRPIGISSAGLINPATGLALTANLCATGKPFPADIEAAGARSLSSMIAEPSPCLRQHSARGERPFRLQVSSSGRGSAAALPWVVGSSVGTPISAANSATRRCLRTLS